MRYDILDTNMCLVYCTASLTGARRSALARSKKELGTRFYIVDTYNDKKIAKAYYMSGAAYDIMPDDPIHQHCAAK